MSPHLPEVVAEVAAAVSAGFTAAAAVGLVGFTAAGAVVLPGFTVGAVAGMAARFMALLPTVAWLTSGMGALTAFRLTPFTHTDSLVVTQ
jgi:hypothetical protein